MDVINTRPPQGFSPEALACAVPLVLDDTPVAAAWRATPDGVRLLLSLLSALLGAVAPTLKRLSDAAASSSWHHAPVEAFDEFAVESLGSLLCMRPRVYELELAMMAAEAEYESLSSRMSKLARALLRPMADGGGGDGYQAVSTLVHLHAAGAAPVYTAHLAAGQRQLGAGLQANQQAVAGVHSELAQLAAAQQQQQQQLQQQMQQLLQRSIALEEKLLAQRLTQPPQPPQPPAAAPQPAAAHQPAAATAATVPQGYTFGAFPLQPGSPTSPSSPLSRRARGVVTATSASPSSRAGSRGSGGRPNPKAAGGQQRASPLAGGAQRGTSTPPQGRRLLQAPQGPSPRTSASNAEARVFDFLPAAQRDVLLAGREQRLRRQGQAEGPAPQQGHVTAAGGSPPKLQYSNVLYQDDVTDVDMHG